jgi:hypothetical protein
MNYKKTHLKISTIVFLTSKGKSIFLNLSMLSEEEECEFGRGFE